MFQKRMITLTLLIALSFTLIGCKIGDSKNQGSPASGVETEANNLKDKEQIKNGEGKTSGQGEISDQQGTDVGKVRQGDWQERVKELIHKSEKMIQEKNWSEAGNYLSQAKEISNGDQILSVKHRDDIEDTGWIEDSFIDALIGGYVFTKEDTRILLQQEDFRIPEQPKEEILKREANEVLGWFRDYQIWRMNMAVIPLDYYYTSRPERPVVVLFLGDALDELTEVRKKFLASGYGEYRELNSYWIELGGITLHHSGFGGFGLWDTFLELSNPDNDLLDLEVNQNEVIFKIYKRGPGYDVWEGTYEIRYQVERKTDGTFRVGDYKYTRME